MAAKDVFHNTVKLALQKDGWKITHDPFYIRAGGVELYIDLGAEKLIAAQKDNQKIAVEVKSFLAASAIAEFHTALGQFLNYRVALQKQEPDRILYLAITLDIFDNFFRLDFIQDVMKIYQLNLLIFDPEQEEVIEWK